MPGLPVHKEVPEKQIIIESDYLRSVWGQLPIFYAKIRQFSKGGECYRHSGYLQSLAPAVPGPSQQPMKPLASCSDHRTFLQTHNCTLMTAECAFGRGKGKRQVEGGMQLSKTSTETSSFILHITCGKEGMSQPCCKHIKKLRQFPLLSDKSTGHAARQPSWTCPRKGTSTSTPRFASCLELLTLVQKLTLRAKPWGALCEGFYTLLCWFCMPCLPLLNLNRMEGCKFTIGDMSVFAQHALYTFINFVLNGGCDFTPGGNQG